MKLTNQPSYRDTKGAQASPSSLRMDFRGGLEAAIQTVPNAIGPLLLFAAVLGPAGAMSGLWAALVTATAARVAALALGSNRCLISSARMASLAAFTALALQLARAATGSGVPDASARR